MKVEAITLSLLYLGLLNIHPSLAQTQQEIDQVTATLGRPQTKSSTLSFLAGIDEGQGNYQKALDSYKKISEIYKSDPGLGPASMKYAWILTKMALCYKALGNTSEATSMCQQALAIVGDKTPENMPDETQYLLRINENYRQVMGRTAPPRTTAAKMPPAELKGLSSSEIPNLAAAESLAIQDTQRTMQFGVTSFEYLKSLLYLANVFTLEKKYSNAEPIFKKIIAQVETQLGPNTSRLVVPLSNYGFMLKQAGKSKEANSMLVRIKQINSQNPR